ncbi:MAG: anhydro-N-acetylmuramic acid kinase [Gammaproteobacteria bacterium]|nr:anhydro-N-acetylmuramic acid kinase [Pseudomonadales bacterium]MCP5331708.1 anhydro-N-acetylmuramic acid kinase [Pseudomonadales bacterium]
MSAHEYFIGMLSGTSMDGIDCAIIDFAQQPPTLLASHSEVIPPALKDTLLALCAEEKISLLDLGQADTSLGQVFAAAIRHLLDKANLHTRDILAIGSHGQTIKHHPSGPYPFTLQIGDPNTIAHMTGICTVADFRRRDMAAGGQGAPLAPLFHQGFFATDAERRAILNLGGIANVSLLAHGDKVLTGFDTGPSNVLMDGWISRKRGQPFDAQGQWAREGKVSQTLLTQLLNEPYLRQTAPKSTGRELFNMNWLDTHLQRFTDLSDTDVQATLLEYTARTIADSVDWQKEGIAALYACGGGARNDYLLERLQALLPDLRVASSAEAGLDPQWVEAMTFAWLARKTWYGEPVDSRSVTGATQACIHGAIYEVVSDRE